VRYLKIATILNVTLAIAVNAMSAMAQNNLPLPTWALPAPSSTLPTPASALPLPGPELPIPVREPKKTTPNTAFSPSYLHSRVVFIPHYQSLNKQVRIAMESFGGSPSFGIFDLMWPLASNVSTILYWGARGLIETSNNGLTNKLTQTATFELGYRHMIHDAFILGGYMMVDRQITGLNNYFTQLNPGFEYLSTAWDVRANGYLPVGKTRRFLGVGFGLPGNVPALSGHNISLETFLNNEIAQAGFDVEVGRSLPGAPRLRGYAGYSHYFARAGGFVVNGARMRVDYLFGDHTELEFRDAYDHIFGNRIYFGVRFILGGNTQLVPPTSLEWKMTSFPIRARGVEAIPQSLAQGSQVVHRHVFYVDSNAAAGGNGTVERPFTTMAAALAAAAPFSDSIIYVYQGAGTYPMGAATFTDRQTLTGQGGNWFFDGVLLLPGSSALRPDIDGTITTTGSNNLLENVGLSNPGAPGTGSGITVTGLSTTLIRNVRVGSAGAEFSVGVNAFGVVDIVNSQLTTSAPAGLTSGVTANGGALVRMSNTNIDAGSTGPATVVGVIGFAGSLVTANNGSITATNAFGGTAFGLIPIGGTMTINNVLVNSNTTTGTAFGAFDFGGILNLNNSIVNATTGGLGVAIALNIAGGGAVVNAAGTTINATGSGASSAVTVGGGTVFNDNGGNVCIVNGVVVACP